MDNLEKFVNVYLSRAFWVAGDAGEKGISLDKFDENVRTAVATELNVSKDYVKHLHHAMHWALFLEHEGSPLSLVSNGKGKESGYYVKSGGERGVEAVNSLAGKILERHGEYMSERAKNYKPLANQVVA